MTLEHDPRQNHLLGRLPCDEYQRLAPHLELVELKRAQTLVEPGDTMYYAYFPVDSILSLLHVTEDGNSTGIAVVGQEGIVGISHFMGGETASTYLKVHSAGPAYRIKGHLLKDEFERGGSLQSILLRYTQAMITQMAQTAVCNRYHSVDQQLCRWLLLSLDRLPTNELVITQQRLASLLGVRREGVTDSALKLQKAQLISYSRGVIHILDRPGLEARACECYSTVKNEYDRLLTCHSPDLTLSPLPRVASQVKRPLSTAKTISSK